MPPGGEVRHACRVLAVHPRVAQGFGRHAVTSAPYETASGLTSMITSGSVP
jgi:hypothetical protein